MPLTSVKGFGAMAQNGIDSENQEAAVAREWARQLIGLTPERVLQETVSRFGDGVVFATSLGAEDQVITHMLATLGPGVPTFSLDTGRLFPETYDLVRRTEERYGIRIRLMFPDATEVEHMTEQHGVNLFLESVELRKQCCHVRKIAPLRRALTGRGAWICGLRREQSVTRTDLQAAEWDDANGLVKVNPLCDWTEEQVWDTIKAQNIPYNPLHDRGFASIGCACCTRAISPGEDVRAGRWWWENPEHKECGLHLCTDANGKPSLTRACCP